VVTETVQIIITERGSAATAAGINRVGTAAKSAASSVKFLAASLAALGVGIGLASVTSTLITFEQRMAGVKAITGATEEEFAALTETARKLGATTVFTASEAAQGLRLFAQAGFTVKESTDAIAGALNLAIAGELGLAEAVDIAANAVRGFGLDASETNRVADVLAATATSTNTNVSLLAEGLKFVAPVAAAAGVSIEETSAALGVLSDAGLKGTLAGTGLRKIFSRLLNPTKDVRSALKGAGIALNDVNPRFNDLRTIVARLKPVLADPAAAFKLFGDRGAPAALAIAKLSERFEQLTVVTEEAEGRSAQIAETLLDTLGGSLKLLKSALEEAALQFGEGGFGGALRQAVDFATAVVSALTGMDNQLAKNNKSVGQVADAFRTFGKALTEAKRIGETISELWGQQSEVELPSLGQVLQTIAHAFVIFFSSIETGVRAIVAGFQAIRVAGEKLRRFLGLEEDPTALANAERALSQANEELFQSSLRTEAKLRDMVNLFKKSGEGAEGAAGGVGELTTALDELGDEAPAAPTLVPDIAAPPPTTTDATDEAVKKQEAAVERIRKLTDALRIARDRDVEPLNAQLEKLRQQQAELERQKALAGERGEIDEGLALIGDRIAVIEKTKARLLLEQDNLMARISALAEQIRDTSPEIADEIERAALAALEVGGGLEKVNAELRQIPGRGTAELQREQQRAGKIGEEVGKTLAGGISKALSGVLKGEAVNFGEILADTASSLLEQALNKVMEKVSDTLGDLLEKGVSGIGGAGKGGGGFGGLGLAAGLGVGLGLLAGALRDTTASVGAELAESPVVEDIQATRGIVAGPTNIPIFQVGADLKEALQTVEELLERIAVAVESDAPTATTATLDQQAGDEILSSSPTMI
jgi:TP901 family phage tail tape measure protein